MDLGQWSGTYAGVGETLTLLVFAPLLIGFVGAFGGMAVLGLLHARTGMALPDWLAPEATDETALQDGRPLPRWLGLTVTILWATVLTWWFWGLPLVVVLDLIGNTTGWWHHPPGSTLGCC